LQRVFTPKIFPMRNFSNTRFHFSPEYFFRQPERNKPGAFCAKKLLYPKSMVHSKKSPGKKLFEIRKNMRNPVVKCAFCEKTSGFMANPEIVSSKNRTRHAALASRLLKHAV